MAVISCPVCSKKISDKATECPHCDTVMDMDIEERERLARKQIAKKTQKLSTQSLFAMVFFLGGFWFMYFQAPEPDSPQMMISQGVVAIGFVWYIVNRIRLLLLKHAAK